LYQSKVSTIIVIIITIIGLYIYNAFHCYSCQKEDGVPLASNDSDDDISDEDDNLLSQDSKSSMYAYA